MNERDWDLTLDALEHLWEDFCRANIFIQILYILFFLFIAFMIVFPIIMLIREIVKSISRRIKLSKSTIIMKSIKVNNAPLAKSKAPQIYVSDVSNSFNPTESVLIEIYKNDPNFNYEQFINYVKLSFIEIQHAFTERNIEKIRLYECPELYLQHKAKIEEDIRLNRINIIEGININNSFFGGYKREYDTEYLTVYMLIHLKNYTIDEFNRKIIYGSNRKLYTTWYRIGFMRKLHNIDDSSDIVTECDNCGAPVTNIYSLYCEFCNSVLDNPEKHWQLYEMKGFIGQLKVDQQGKILPFD